MRLLKRRRVFSDAFCPTRMTKAPTTTISVSHQFRTNRKIKNINAAAKLAARVKVARMASDAFQDSVEMMARRRA